MQAAAAQARDFGCCRRRLPRVFRLFTFKVVTVVEGLRLHVVQRHVIRSSSVTDAPTAAVGDDERKLAHDFRPRPCLSRSPSHVSLTHSIPHPLTLSLSPSLSISLSPIALLLFASWIPLEWIHEPKNSCLSLFVLRLVSWKITALVQHEFVAGKPGEVCAQNGIVVCGGHT